jgi:hypothetical protein
MSVTTTEPGKGAAPVAHAVPLESPGEWRAALEGIPHSFFHTWEHCHAMFLTTGQPTYLFCAAEGDVRVVCPYVERAFDGGVDIATPYGFSGFAGNGLLSELAERWREFTVSRRYICAFLTLHPLFAAPGTAEMETRREMKSLYVLDTRKPLEDLWRDCFKTRRQTIRKWERSGVSIVTDRERLVRFLLEQYPLFFQRKNASQVYGFSCSTMEFLAGLPNVITLGAARDGCLEAAVMVGCTPYGAEYLFNINLPKGQWNSSALVWEAARRVQTLGLPHFNLGGGLAKEDSLSDFKRRFGARRYPLLALRQVLLPEVHAQLCAKSIATCQNSDDAYFPPYRTRN